jgi:hypothetical protein
MATVSENKKFNRDFFDRDIFLDQVIDWIKSNLSPEDVFSGEQLIVWAESNDYFKEEDNE